MIMDYSNTLFQVLLFLIFILVLLFINKYFFNTENNITVTNANSNNANSNNYNNDNYNNDSTNKVRCIEEKDPLTNNNKNDLKIVNNKSKSKTVFCSSSCASHHNNLKRPVGLRRSALEIWIESKLVGRYPNITFHFNRKDAIGSELDIYIPEFKTAFELNGFFHYFRIKKNNYGSIILKRTKANDARKVKACNKARINLHVINTSRVGHFTFFKSNRILSKITKIIDKLVQI